MSAAVPRRPHTYSAYVPVCSYIKTSSRKAYRPRVICSESIPVRFHENGRLLTSQSVKWRMDMAVRGPEWAQDARRHFCASSALFICMTMASNSPRILESPAIDYLRISNGLSLTGLRIRPLTRWSSRTNSFFTYATSLVVPPPPQNPGPLASAQALSISMFHNDAVARQPLQIKFSQGPDIRSC